MALLVGDLGFLIIKGSPNAAALLTSGSSGITAITGTSSMVSISVMVKKVLSCCSLFITTPIISTPSLLAMILVFKASLMVLREL
jgi:hypothetical protein